MRRLASVLALLGGLLLLAGAAAKGEGPKHPGKAGGVVQQIEVHYKYSLSDPKSICVWYSTALEETLAADGHLVLQNDGGAGTAVPGYVRIAKRDAMESDDSVPFHGAVFAIKPDPNGRFDLPVQMKPDGSYHKIRIRFQTTPEPKSKLEAKDCRPGKKILGNPQFVVDGTGRKATK